MSTSSFSKTEELFVSNPQIRAIRLEAAFEYQKAVALSRLACLPVQAASRLVQCGLTLPSRGTSKGYRPRPPLMSNVRPHKFRHADQNHSLRRFCACHESHLVLRAHRCAVRGVLHSATRLGHLRASHLFRSFGRLSFMEVVRITNRGQSQVAPAESPVMQASHLILVKKPYAAQSVLCCAKNGRSNRSSSSRFSHLLAGHVRFPTLSGKLVQVEQCVRPNPSIERTSPGKPGAASHLKR